MRNISSEEISPVDGYAVAIRVVYGVIAALAFLLNFLFCVILIRKPALLKQAHNFLLLSLAITDLLTG